MAKKGKKSARKSKKVQKTESEIHLENITIIVKERLKKEKWSIENKTLKDLTDKERELLNARRAVELQHAVEDERLRLLQEEKRQKELDRIAGIEKEQRDVLEESLRIEQLRETYRFTKELEKNFIQVRDERVGALDWHNYCICDGLPNPFNLGDMTNYLHVMSLDEDKVTPKLAIQRTDELLLLLFRLHEVAYTKVTDDCKPQNWTVVRNMFRKFQQFNLDSLTYCLIRDILMNFEIIDAATARKAVIHPTGVFSLVIWALLQLPVSAPNVNRPRKQVTHLKFPEVQNMEVKLPNEVDVWAKCIRAMYVSYEHFNHKDHSYCPPPFPEELKANLAEVTAKEFKEKQILLQTTRDQIIAERELEVKRAVAMNQSGETEQTKKALKKAIALQQEYVKVEVSNMYCTIEDEEYAKIRESLITTVPENFINQRQYRILGGVFYLELYHQPSQATTMILSDITLTSLTIPKWLHPVPFQYIKPSPPSIPSEEAVDDDSDSDEEEEEDMSQYEIDYNQLIHVSLKLTSSVLWLDTPIVCLWDKELNAWTTDDIYDANFDEETQSLEFKLGRFGIISMAVNRYINMPFKSWNMEPSEGNSVVITIAAAMLTVEFTIKNSLVCVSNIEDAPNDALDWLIGKFLPLLNLMQTLRMGGVDLFPNYDVFCYVNDVCEKQWAMEDHLYVNMAHCSLLYHFTWSKWNRPAGRRNAVMQMKEVQLADRGIVPEYVMVMVTPLKALLVNCNEDSETFNEEGIKKMKFYADLIHLVRGIAPITIKCKLDKVPLNLVNSVAQFLSATRILSLC